MRWAKDMMRPFIEQGIQQANKHMKRCPNSARTREMQIKRYYFVLIRWTKIKKFDNNVIC